MESLHCFNGAEKVLFRRLIDNGNDPEMAVKTMALWGCLGSSEGLHKLVLKIMSENGEFLASVTAEARAILECISKPNSKTPTSPDHIFPVTSSLADDPSASLIKIFSRKDALSTGVQKLCGVLCYKLADTNNGERRTEERWLTELNPNAKEWNPMNDSAPEEDRCLFLTFSNGYPLSEHQIVNFFTRKYGPCIERVYVHYPEGGNEPPLFGKVVFVASTVPAIILGGRQETKFTVESKTLWCKKYEARKARSRVLASAGRG